MDIENSLGVGRQRYASIIDLGRIRVVRKCHIFLSSGVQLYCCKTSLATSYDRVSILFCYNYSNYILRASLLFLQMLMMETFIRNAMQKVRKLLDTHFHSDKF